MTKRTHIARGAQLGLESALLAAKGFSGPSTVLEGERGFLRVYSPSPRPELLLEGLGERWLLLDMMVKAYACHGTFQSVIDAIHRFRRSHPYDVTRVERVTVTAAGTGGVHMLEERFANREPRTVLGAQYSLPFSVALALSRDVGDPRSYSEETLWDPQVRALAGRVELVAEPGRFGGPGQPTAEVSVTIAGQTFTLPVTDWKGAPTNPYTYDEMAEKFRLYARPHLPPDRIEEVIRRVRDLEQERDVAELARLVRAG
jgi:2-methylcitrate dehydratase PrpD